MIRYVRITREKFKGLGFIGYIKNKKEDGSTSWEKVDLPANYKYIAIHKDPSWLLARKTEYDVYSDPHFFSYSNGQTFIAGYSINKNGLDYKIGCLDVPRKETKVLYELID